MLKPRYHIELEPAEPVKRLKFAGYTSLIVAGLLAFGSLGGILIGSTYAHETANWRIQAIAQDWIDLLVAVPWLTVSAILVLRGSRGARLLLGGGLAYTIYSFMIYAFAVHFNWLFLVYCSVLGGATYAMVALGSELADEDVRSWFDRHLPRRSIAIFEIACGSLFAMLWLSQLLPAVARSEAPRELAEVGLLTNPVHVLDLCFVLPAMVLGGIELLQRRPLGYALSGIALGFNVLMALNLAGITVGMYVAQLTPTVGIVIGFGALATIGGVLLARMLTAIDRSKLVAH